MQLEDTETPRKHVHECVCGVRVHRRHAPSHTLFRRHEQRVDVLEAFKLRLVDLLHDVPEKGKKKNGGEKIKKLVKIDRKLRLQQEMSTK